MKKINLFLTIVLLSCTSSSFAAPIVGLIGQGFPNYNAITHQVDCLQGWYTCHVTDPAITKPNITDLVELDAFDENSSTLELTYSLEFIKEKCPKLLVGRKFILEFPVLLDKSISKQVNERMKNPNGSPLCLDKGIYEYVIIKDKIRIKKVHLISPEEAFMNGHTPK